MTTDNVLFVDTETTGLNPSRHPIWEVGCIEADGTEHCWQVRITDEQYRDAEPIALEINRFDERSIQFDLWALLGGVELLTPAESALRFADLSRGKHLVGAVVSFDEERLRRMHDLHLGRPEGKYPWHYHLIDVEALAVGYLEGRQAQHEAHHGPTGEKYGLTLPWKSDQITERLGLTADETTKHTALADARWARDIYMAIRG